MGVTRRAFVAVLALVPFEASATDSDGYGTVPYSELGYGGSRSDCFIATAAIGTSNHEDVASLRRFRDDVLLESRLGRLFVWLYYSTSPPIARWIASGHYRRTIVRRLCVEPAARLTEKLT